MPPAHGNLPCVQSVVARQVQQLGIKSEALDALLFENDAAPFAAEGLETALGIDKRQPQHDSHDLIEKDARKLTESRLVHGDQGAVHGARTDSHITVFQGLEELPSLFNGCGKVRVGKESNSAPCFLHTVADAV